MSFPVFLRWCPLLWLMATAAAAQPYWSAAPGPYGGTTVHALARPAGGGVLAGTPGGVFRSADEGRTWTADGAGLAVPEVRALLPLPDGAVLAGTYGGGVYRRGERETTWTPTGPGPTFVTALAVTDDGTLYAGAAGGLYASADGGTTWTSRLIENQTLPVQALTTADGAVFAATPAGLFRSGDGGLTWAYAALGLTDLNVTALAANAAGTLFAGVSPATGGCTLYRSRGMGALWTCVQPPVDPLLVPALAVADDGTLYAGGFQAVFRSGDEGDGWTRTPAGVTTVRALLPLPGGAVLAGTEGRGVLRTDDGAAWTPANEGLPSGLNDLLLDADGTVYAATDGGVFRSADGGDTWTLLADGDPFLGASSLAFDAAGRLVAATLTGAYRLAPGAMAWEALGPPGTALNDLARAPDGDLLAGFHQGLYRLHGAAWTFLPLLGPDAAWRDVGAVAVTSAGTVLAGAAWDAFRLEDDGATWTRLALDTSPFFEVQVFGEAPDGTLYAGTRFFGVVRSDDGGRTWRLALDGLTGMEDVRALAFGPDGAAYAGTFGSGVLRHEGGQWVPFNDGLDARRIRALAFGPDGAAYAGTAGGGLYRHRPAQAVSRAPAPALPDGVAVQPPFPNPAADRATLRVDLPAPVTATVALYDVLGRRVRSGPPRALPAGAGQALALNLAGLPPGLYLYRLTLAGRTAVWTTTGRVVRQR